MRGEQVFPAVGRPIGHDGQMLTSTARRAEDLITEKIRRDAALPGSRRSLDVQTGHWGRVVALRVPALAELSPYNKARGVNEDDLSHLDAVTAFFGDAGIDPTLEVWAGDASDRLGAALARRGLYAGAVTATLHAHLDGPPAADPVTVGRVTVEELDPSDDGTGDGHTDYVATLADGYGLTGARPAHLAMLRGEHDPATVRRYLARVDGRPAAAASLYLHPQGALLSGAATAPRYRRHGCQGALIGRRLSDAAALTDFAVATVAFGSASQSNLERAGFRLTHTRTAWHPLRHEPADGLPR